MITLQAIEAELETEVGSGPGAGQFFGTLVIGQLGIFSLSSHILCSS